LKKIGIIGLFLLIGFVGFGCQETSTPTLLTTTSTTTTTSTDATNYTIQNGGFESGALQGWEIISGDAFSAVSVLSDSVSGKIGMYYLGLTDESACGVLASPTFTIAGSGFISFSIGAAYFEGLTYISVVDALTNIEIARFGNPQVNSVLPNVLIPYLADLSSHIGSTVKILLVDQSTQNTGYLLFDQLVTYYETMPSTVGFNNAINIKPIFTNSSSTPNQLVNENFANGLTGFSVIGESNSFLASHINSSLRLSNRPNENDIGLLRSSAFKVGGTGLISMRIGGTLHEDVTYVSVKVVGTNEEIFRTYSDRWKTADEEATHLYFIDVSDYLGESLDLEFVDNSRGDWGLITIEDIHTVYLTNPHVNDEIAVNLLVPRSENPEYSAMRGIIDPLVAAITNATDRLTFQKCFYATIDGIQNNQGTWGSVVNTFKNGHTFITTGDINAMWLRDSSAQVLPYLQFMTVDEDVRLMVKGLLLEQFELIRRDPYSNAFNADGSSFESKFEIDSLCYPIWLAYEYHQITGDDSIFDQFFVMTVETIITTFIQEQNHQDSVYRIENSYDRSVGSNDVNTASHLIWTGYRPSDDVAYYKYNIPDNMFAVSTLEKIADILSSQGIASNVVNQATALALDVRSAIELYGVYLSPTYGKIYAYEVTGANANMASSDQKLLMDIANIPSLLSIPWLGYASNTDDTYLNTRAFILSTDNPYYYEGTYAKGIGDPHDMVSSTDNPHPQIPVPWHMAIAMQALTSTSQTEIETCVGYLIQTTGGTYVMHEAFNANNPSVYSRNFFTWPCSLFAHVYLTEILDYHVSE